MRRLILDVWDKTQTHTYRHTQIHKQKFEYSSNSEMYLGLAQIFMKGLLYENS